jgi:hypothetical protein
MNAPFTNSRGMAMLMALQTMDEDHRRAATRHPRRRVRRTRRHAERG